MGIISQHARRLQRGNIPPTALNFEREDPAFRLENSGTLRTQERRLAECLVALLRSGHSQLSQPLVSHHLPLSHGPALMEDADRHRAMILSWGVEVLKTGSG